MERLQKIIAKLEAKIKPLHDENHLLKVRLEELQLDHELALEQIKAKELDIPDSQESQRRVHELTEQVEALEMLKKLSDELEQDQREEIARLEVQVAELRDELETTTTGGDTTNEHTHTPVNDPSDALQQQLSFLRLELEAAQYELKAHKQGVLDVLRETAEFDLEMVRYMLAVHGTDADTERVRSLFDMFKQGKVSPRDISDTLGELLGSLESRSHHSPKFSAEHARTYLFNTTKDERVHLLGDSDIARAFDDPSLLEELVKPVLQTAQSPRPAQTPLPASKQASESAADSDAGSDPKPAAELAAELALSEETETLKLKIEILTEKAARAAQFAASLEQAKRNAHETSLQTQKLSRHIDELTDQLQAREGEITILRAAQAPDLDTISVQHTLGLLNDTIKLLHKQDPPFRLGPLQVSTGYSLSTFAGSQIVKQVWEAIDTFEVPPTRRVYIEQMRKLSLIDA